MNEVVTNNLPRWVAAQVYLEDIDFYIAAKEKYRRLTVNFISSYSDVC